MICLYLRRTSGTDFMYCHKDAREAKEVKCVYNCVDFVILIVLSPHLRLGFWTLDMNCRVSQTNMYCCKSLYNILLICLFPCGSCVDTVRTTFAPVPVLSHSLFLLNCVPSTSAVIETMLLAKLPTEKSPLRSVRFHQCKVNAMLSLRLGETYMECHKLPALQVLSLLGLE